MGNKFIRILKGAACTVLSIILSVLGFSFLMIIPMAFIENIDIVGTVVIEILLAVLIFAAGLLLKKLSHTAVKVSGVIIVVLIAMTLMGYLIPLVSEAKGIVPIVILATVVGIALIVAGVKTKKKLFTVFSAIALMVFYIAAVGAANEFPWAIRKIQGSDFVEMWLVLFMGMMIAALIAVAITCVTCADGNIYKAKEKVYSDSDLMILRGFDRYKRVGYYILKAVIHKIIRYEENDEGAFISINPEVDENERREYCQANPQVKKILQEIADENLKTEVESVDGISTSFKKLNYGKKEENLYTSTFPKGVRVADIVREVDTNPQI